MGPTGPIGPIGLVGLQGTTGPPGIQGPDGHVGCDGSDGRDGRDGRDGATGATGATGASGNNGNNGKDGVTGPNGATGATGATGPVGPSAGFIPIGGIIMWSGTSMPSSDWALCDGTNRTPNLSNQFILSSGTLAVGSTGGSQLISVDNLPSHTHTISSTDNGHYHGINDSGHVHGINDGGHGHQYTVYAGDGADVEGNYFNSPQPLQNNYSSALQNTSTQTTGISINSQETGISIQTSYADISSSSSYEGGNQPYMPPYYVLAFIMRIS